MSEEFEIRNKVAENTSLVNFDLASLRPAGKRLGVDIKDFLFQDLILKEKDFRQKVAEFNIEEYRDSYVYVYCSVDAIVPLWAYFLLANKLMSTAKKVVYGSQKELELLLFHDAMETYDFSNMQNKRVLVKGCSDFNIPENAYIELVGRLRPLVKSLMFGEACSNVPILKN
ncbi:DUF2480 family protein [Elizabethkingia argentiflava]|uniref:DUF2480 family protein n=1 Tax=Elizabethkingia argenteiflava TaxID=2681556 RepID=A0A845PXU3_9FLAO|nr:DUF2480 family protein [Elizabethkingia argenteiflava]NAW51287.1 DUF2480 family protein [Elizabethkingia argenteiflava]